ncbi:MAG TPA: DNA-processing protein DprA [Chitinophagaceae bacterium]|nr:DNA-processing protein DprA [Chitinophagaceae bacterium]
MLRLPCSFIFQRQCKSQCLSQVYPSQHTSLACEIVKEGGGLLTEFMSPAMPDRHQFPTHNRIVAGLSDATIVVEVGTN